MTYQSPRRLLISLSLFLLLSGGVFVPVRAQDDDTDIFFDMVTTCRKDDNLYSICLVDIETSEFKVLTDDAGVDHQATWSPDGQQIVFSSDRGAGEDGDLYIMDSDGQNLQTLTDNDIDEVWPIWSADGASIVFSAQTEAFFYELFKLSIEDGTREQLSFGADAYHNPTWSQWTQDGERIIFHVFNVTEGKLTNPTNLLGILDLTDNSVEYFEPRPGMSALTPTWSPDGTQIIYSSYTVDHQVLYLLDLQTEEHTRLIAPELGYVHEYSPVWSPDGTQILFLGRTETDYGIWLMDLPDGEPILVSPTDTDYLFLLPSWRPVPEEE